NAVADRMIYSFSPEEGLKHFRMNRWKSFAFLWKKLGDNIVSSKASLLPDDIIIGQMTYSAKPITIPKDAFYLGGVGDGAWFTVQQAPDNKVLVKRFTSKGILEYVTLGEPMEPLDFQQPFTVIYDSHLLYTHIKQRGRKIRINHIQRLPNEDFQYKDLKELYA